jgi:esterase/lipase
MTVLIKTAQSGRRLALLSILTVLLTGSADTQAMGPAPKVLHYPETAIEPRGNILLIHGLNLKPSKMLPLAQRLCTPSNGLQCTILTLSGHEEDTSETMDGADAETWKTETFEAIQSLRSKAIATRTPLFLVGYSLGGLMGTWGAQSRPEDNKIFDAMVLIAPAIFPKWYTRITPYLPLPDHFHLPSKNHPEYRANPGTSLAAYRAMFTVINEVQSQKNLDQTLGKTPTLVFLNPRDELVSEDRTASWIKKVRLTSWTSELIDGLTSSLTPHYQHLMVDEASMGAHAWESLIGKIENHFAAAVPFTRTSTED